MAQFLAAWDPCWGANGDIYHLGATPSNGMPFWRLRSGLYRNYQLVYLPKRGRLCAGAFARGCFFGSLSLFTEGGGLGLFDQLVFACDSSWRVSCYLRPSEFLKSPSPFFSRLFWKGRLLFPFRDPAPLPSGNFAVCTGGHPFGVLGNVCEISFDGSEFRLVSETILGDTMQNRFIQIERVTCWNEFMFFSVDGATAEGGTSDVIHVAVLGSNGLYEYSGIVEGSFGCYGPSVSSDLRMCFWYKKKYRISNPIGVNLIYESGSWRLLESGLLPLPDGMSSG